MYILSQQSKLQGSVQRQAGSWFPNGCMLVHVSQLKIVHTQRLIPTIFCACLYSASIFWQQSEKYSLWEFQPVYPRTLSRGSFWLRSVYYHYPQLPWTA